ncbi:MAG TPA: EAL domain-containing protein [Methylophilaceae bacterium]|nr:EAL domain-containing protein [Methylophilaceae bacterium]
MIVIFLLISLTICMELLSSVRAYVGGESQWSKGQKVASYYLNVYARTHDEADYQKFLDAIAVPLGDHKARLALNQPTPNIEAAKQGFIEGQNHPEDIPGLIRLYLYFNHTSLMKESIQVWTEADILLAKLNSLAQELHMWVTADDDNKEGMVSLLEQINTVSLQLTPLEDTFSRALGEVSRKAKLLINIVMLVVTLLLLGLGLLLSRRMVQRSVASATALQQNEMRLSAVVDTAMDAVVQIDDRGIIKRWSGQAEFIFGWTSDEAMGRSLQLMITTPNLLQAHLKELHQPQTTSHEYIPNKRLEVQALHRDGTEFSAELTISPVKWEDKLEYCAFIRDITKRKQTAEQLMYRAHYDEITGLPNRVLFQDRLDQETKKSQRTRLPLALMFLDIDHFKEVNDTLGHDKGDILLKEAAQRLLSCVRETDTVARFGGDEFIVILSQLEDLSSVERIANNLLAKLVEPFQLDNEVAYVSISIGITLYPDDAATHDELIKNADQAMYLAKKSGRNRFNYFTPSMQEAAQIYRKLANDMRPALTEQQYRVYYQPILHLATGSIHKAEALIRWQHPTRGLISPAEFIPIAEETGMINDIGDWVFFTAAQQAADWRSRFNPDFQISVNKSPAQFQDHGKNRVAWGDQLAQLGLSGESIVVEITEGMLMETSEATKRKLLEFRDAGIQVALDDFGTGYSSLSYLNKFDIDYIKIDQSFVRNLAIGSHDMVLCEAIIAMAHKLGMQVIAEGVETTVQRDLLIAAGCDYAQGYLFSRPVPAEAFEVLLKSRGVIAKEVMKR